MFLVRVFSDVFGFFSLFLGFRFPIFPEAPKWKKVKSSQFPLENFPRSFNKTSLTLLANYTQTISILQETSSIIMTQMSGFVGLSICLNQPRFKDSKVRPRYGSKV